MQCLFTFDVSSLTPLADMINHSPYVEREENEERSHWIKAPFTLFHTLSGNNSITVRSDRDIFLRQTHGEGTMPVQLFEDYGPVDSSLFLEAHGFVPDENPNNCAIVTGSNFLRRHAAAGRYDENVAYVLRALKILHLIHPHETRLEALDDVCVKANLEIVDDGDVVGRKPASDAIAITSLLLSDGGNPDWIRIEKGHGQTLISLRDKCIAAIHSEDAERVEIRCARFPGSSSIVNNALRTAARRAIASFEDNGDTEDALRLQLQQAELQGRDQLSLALRFRLEERKLLHRIGAVEDEHDVAEQKSVKHQEDYPFDNQETLGKKLIAFESFVETLDIPVKKIKPKIIGNGMRLGAVATADVEVGEPYISLSVNSVIDVDTALADAVNFPELLELLQKYSKPNNDSHHNGGFDPLLLYLLHERFVLKEQSRWWAYLDILPTIGEMSTFHPLFFDREEIDTYLSGSDVRRFILRYQQLSSERHKALSADLAANLVLGWETILDRNKVFWAIAVLDSRSIWWGGNRHLVPLLDLVNADGIGIAHETRLEYSDDIEGNVAVTRASRRLENSHQVLENYAQPNYLLFTYHGFLLENNANDCALLDGLFIHRNDPGAKISHLLPTIAPTFCMRNKDSVEELSRFLKIKYGLPRNNDIVDDNVRPYLIQVLEERIARLTEAFEITVGGGGNILPRLQFMRQIVKNDLFHFQFALKSYVIPREENDRDLNM